MANEDERRRAQRIPINSEFATMPSYISDLSEYGVFVHTEEPAALGSKVRLRFTVLLDDPVIIEAEGRVVRHAPEGMGIEFTDLDPEMVLRINDVVARQKPRDSGPPLGPQGEQPAADSEPLGMPPAGGGGLSFRLPPLPGQQEEEVDESQQTGLFRKVDTETQDDSE